jgi:epsilon-lactone hydrolase
MLPTPHFRGPAKYRLRCAASAALAIARATARRLRHGPLMPSWNWAVELGTALIRDHLRATFDIPNIVEARHYLDTLVIESPAISKVHRKEISDHEIRGSWLIPSHPSPVTLLYIHGGGFAFYPKDSYAGFISHIALATNTSAFALDYRLSPENKFSTQLEDVCTAYLWLLKNGTDPHRLVVAGDSAGGNLTIALLLHLRDQHQSLPALGIALSPATEFDAIRPSMSSNERSDWITGTMALEWRDWYCRPEERSNPLVSLIHADLRGLPPIYIQAGRAEILYDSICAFALEAKKQGANLAFESWADMSHVFQFFGDDAPQSSEAIRRIAEVISQTVVR